LATRLKPPACSRRSLWRWKATRPSISARTCSVHSSGEILISSLVKGLPRTNSSFPFRGPSTASSTTTDNCLKLVSGLTTLLRRLRGERSPLYLWRRRRETLVGRACPPSTTSSSLPPSLSREAERPTSTSPSSRRSL